MRSLEREKQLAMRYLYLLVFVRVVPAAQLTFVYCRAGARWLAVASRAIAQK